MAQGQYVFDGTAGGPELERLRSIERIFDPATRRRLSSAGLKPGSRCLEAGAGAGSIMAWMAETAGPSGAVTAVEIDPRFLGRPPSNVSVVVGDLRVLPLAPGGFDVVHCRYVLVHLPEARAVLKKLWDAVAPGGSLVVEEPDFSMARAMSGDSRGIEAFDKVQRALARMFTGRGMPPAFGALLPSALQALGASNLTVENDCPLCPGNSDMAAMMRASTEQLRDKYVATGEVTSVGVDAYMRLTSRPDFWAVYYATIAVTAQKP